MILCSFADKSLVQIETSSAIAHEVCKTEDCYDKMVFSPAGLVACVGAQDKSIAFRSSTTGDLLCESAYGHTDRITSLRCYDYEDTAIAQTTSTDGLVIQWSCPAQESVVPRPSPVRKVIRKEHPQLSPVKGTLRTPLRRNPSLTGRQTPTERPRTPSKLALGASGSPVNAVTPSISGSRGTAVDTKIMLARVVAQLKNLQLRNLSSDQLKELRDASSWYSVMNDGSHKQQGTELR